MNASPTSALRACVLTVLLCLGGWGMQAQTAKQNLAKFDYRPYHFGFLLSGNTSSFNFSLRPDFTFADSLLSVENNSLSGFNLALLASVNVNPVVHVRFIPGLSFQDRGSCFGSAAWMGRRNRSMSGPRAYTSISPC